MMVLQRIKSSVIATLRGEYDAYPVNCMGRYCECFASGIYCDGCNCLNCHNSDENEAARREAVEATLEHNSNAFRPKIASSPHGARDSREEAGEVLVSGKHNRGRHCKKLGCLKKCCECFQAKILCSEICRCMDCKNYEGSEERQALCHGDHSSHMHHRGYRIFWLWVSSIEQEMECSGTLLWINNERFSAQAWTVAKANFCSYIQKVANL